MILFEIKCPWQTNKFMRTTTKNYQGIDMKEEYRMAAVDLGLPSRQLVELP